MKGSATKLPRAGAEREALREKGQFWTPDWVAEGMVAYVLTGGSNHIFDPAVGAGAFFRAAKAVAQELGRNIELLGMELDSTALAQAHLSGLADRELKSVVIGDFIFDPPSGPFKAIVEIGRAHV